MQVRNIRVEELTETCRLSADVQFDTHWVWGDNPFPLWYEFPLQYADYLSAENGDPFVATLLSSAMSLAEPLIITADASVSEKLYTAIPEIQEIYHCWDPRHSRIDVNASIRNSALSAETSQREALFYSLGVDSNYSLAKCIGSSSASESVPQLVMVQGFDVYLWESQRFPPMLSAATELANDLGTEVMAITTNLREFSDRVTDWVRYFHGAALASTALALGDYFSNVKIAASQTYQMLSPRGTHPLLDRLWSTETTYFEHDGLECHRFQKLQALLQFPQLLRRLRVCATSELTDAYNCGRCEKCIRTMLYMYLLGNLEQCETLPTTIELDSIRALRIYNDIEVNQLELLISRLGTSDFDRNIAEVLQERIVAFLREQN